MEHCIPCLILSWSFRSWRRESLRFAVCPACSSGLSRKKAYLVREKSPGIRPHASQSARLTRMSFVSCAGKRKSVAQRYIAGKVTALDQAQEESQLINEIMQAAPWRIDHHGSNFDLVFTCFFLLISLPDSLQSIVIFFVVRLKTKRKMAFRR